MKKSYKKYKQGVFNPIHKNKYKGSTPIVYRSGLELTYMRFLDSNSSIVSWGSESIVIPYIKPTDGKLHRYFLDFNFTIKDIHGKLHKFIIEVKPAKQCKPPKATARKKKKTLLYEQVTWATNTAKWKAAAQWGKKHGYKFQIVTETDIKKLGK
ncbi:MAG: head completion protein [bacterium]|nr:head completion protein [bacterium]